MAMERMPIASATDDQLYSFAESFDLNPKDRDRAKLLALLAPAWNKDYILVPEGALPSADQDQVTSPVAQQSLLGGPGKDDPIVELTIQNGALAGGKDPAAVSVNGFAMVIQRNMRVRVPYRFFLALRDAKRAEVSQPDLTKPPVESEISNYPMQVHSMPSPEAIAAWHERTGPLSSPA